MVKITKSLLNIDDKINHNSKHVKRVKAYLPNDHKLKGCSIKKHGPNKMNQRRTWINYK